MSYIGDFATGVTISKRFTTVGTTGAPTTLSGTPAISVYKSGSNAESTTGVTLNVDYDSRTGFNNVSIDTSADGTFYSAGSDFDIVITAGTVGGTSVVGYIVGTFSLANRSALRPTTAGNTLDVNNNGEAGVDWGNVGNKTTSNALTGTTIATTQKVDIETIKTNPVVNAGTITFPTGATLASTTNITAATGVDVTKLNGTSIAGTGSRVADAFVTMFNVASPVLTTASVNQTGDSFARIGSTGSGLTSLAPASTALSTATWTGTLATNLSTLASHDPGATLGTSTLTQAQVTGGAYALNSASFAFNANVHNAIADQVWEEAIADHSGTAGSTAEALNAAGSAGDPWNTALPGAYASGKAGYILGTYLTGDVYARLGAPAGPSVSADVAAVKTDTGNLVSRITSTLFSGITSLAQWLGLLAGKQVGNSTARTEVRATGAGSGTYDETTDSQEALRDRGDAAYTTAVGFSTHSASDVWAVGTRTLTAGTNIQLPSNGLANVTAWTVNLTGSLSGNVGGISGVTFPANFASLSIDASGRVDLGKWIGVAPLALSSQKVQAEASVSVDTAAIADAVWDEAIAGHLTSGTTGAKLNTAGGAADPLTNEVPGDYDSGTAGWVLGHLTAGQISVTSNVTATDDVLIYPGDDYSATNGNSIDFTNDDGGWPDLTGATIVLEYDGGSWTGSCTNPGNANQTIRFQPTAAETSGLPQGRSVHFRAVFTLSDGDVQTRVIGKLLVQRLPSG